MSLATDERLALDEILELLDKTEVSLLFTLEFFLYRIFWGDADTNTLRYNPVTWA